MLSIMSQFSVGSGAVGIGYDSVTGEVSVYRSFGASIFRYSSTGAALGSYAVPGGGANDFDLDGVAVDFMMNGVLVPAGSMLVFNGESGVVEIYAVNPVTGAIIATLTTGFGASHVVGGSYNPVTGTFFVVQDKVPATALDNLIAEIAPATGAVVEEFPTDTSGFTVNFGDLDVDPYSGALWVVSSDHSSVQRMSVDGAILGTVDLPVGVGALSGIAFIPDSPGEAFVVNTSGTVFRIGGFPVERVGGAGNDVLSGGTGDDFLDGGDGNDTLIGGAGNDTLRGGAAGLDLHYGGDGDDVIIIDRASDIVAGERYDGGAGQDSLILNFNTDGDLSGVTLAGIESLTQSYFNFDTELTAAQLNAVTSISGQSFTLTTGGNVSMTGAAINTQIFNLADAGTGFNLTGSTQTYLITVNGGAGDDRITGGAMADTLNGGGGADVLTGGAGNDIINGGLGADVMRGGAGDDVFTVDNSGDNVVEGSGGGNDSIFASVTYTLLGRQVETLTLTGTANISALGNDSANTLVGNSGNNVLRGGLGKDVLTGGAGRDIFGFDTALGSTNIDRITDFTVVDDTIRLSRSVFSAITANGALSASAFQFGSVALDADDRILYNRATGGLFYDADGVGGVDAVLFARLEANLALTNADFLIVA